MSLWNYLTENKTLSTTIAALGVGGALFWAYTKYKEEHPEEEDHPDLSQANQKEFDIEASINKLKNQINVADPSLSDIKKILTVLANYVKSKTMQINNKFKHERRKKFPHHKRTSQMGEYFKFASEGLTTLQNSIMELQKEQTHLMASIGVNQASIAKYGPQLGTFMQELVLDSKVSAQEVKKSIQMKTEYLSVHGQKLVESLIDISASLSLREKQNIALFLNVVISDEVFELDPELDRDDLDMAYEKYKNQLNSELMKLQNVLMPLMGQLQTALVGDNMGGMGGYGGQHGEEMGGMGMPMGGMGGMGDMNEQMMMQQLQQLRQADPQAYQQLMAMMSAQMGR